MALDGQPRENSPMNTQARPNRTGLRRHAKPKRIMPCLADKPNHTTSDEPNRNESYRADLPAQFGPTTLAISIPYPNRLSSPTPFGQTNPTCPYRADYPSSPQPHHSDEPHQTEPNLPDNPLRSLPGRQTEPGLPPPLRHSLPNSSALTSQTEPNRQFGPKQSTPTFLTRPFPADPSRHTTLNPSYGQPKPIPALPRTTTQTTPIVAGHFEPVPTEPSGHAQPNQFLPRQRRSFMDSS